MDLSNLGKATLVILTTVLLLMGCSSTGGIMAPDFGPGSDVIVPDGGDASTADLSGDTGGPGKDTGGSCGTECCIDSDCDDGNHCNGVESCSSKGLCMAGAPLSCDDENVCTVDSCVPAMGCVHEPDIACAGTAFVVVDTGQNQCWDSAGTGIDCPAEGEALFGQDARYNGIQPAYVDNGDGTVTDARTGLMWQKDPGAKMTWADAAAGADSFGLAGYGDWRLPTIKEMYSLILFDGIDPSGVEGDDTSGLTPFIDDSAFVFEYGDTSVGERIIDVQYATSNIYVSTTMLGDETMFGVNFADGRIKGYGTGPMPGQTTGKTFVVQYVRGDIHDGNAFVDNGIGTVTDQATGFTWLQEDSGSFGVGDAGDGALDWAQALAWCEGLTFAGNDDWRLPNAKELQSIVDYTRSPDTTDSAAIDPVFGSTEILNEKGAKDWPCYWSSTTHANTMNGGAAAYVAFGRCLGYMGGQWLDVHGAGCQRSDPKQGDPANWPQGHGPQGDAIRIYNHVRCVRGGASYNPDTDPPDPAVVASCGDQICHPGEDQTCPQDCQGGPVGTTPCTLESDCSAQGACPPDAAKGCTCAQTPQGQFCIPQCSTDADCPTPPDMTLICSPDGTCIPEGGGPPPR